MSSLNYRFFRIYKYNYMITGKKGEEGIHIQIGKEGIRQDTPTGSGRQVPSVTDTQQIQRRKFLPTDEKQIIAEAEAALPAGEAVIPSRTRTEPGVIGARGQLVSKEKMDAMVSLFEKKIGELEAEVVELKAERVEFKKENALLAETVRNLEKKMKAFETQARENTELKDEEIEDLKAESAKKDARIARLDSTLAGLKAMLAQARTAEGKS